MRSETYSALDETSERRAAEGEIWKVQKNLTVLVFLCDGSFFATFTKPDFDQISESFKSPDKGPAKHFFYIILIVV